MYIYLYTFPIGQEKGLHIGRCEGAEGHEDSPHEVLKLGNLGKDLDEFSLDTVKMFADDAASAGYTL